MMLAILGLVMLTLVLSLWLVNRSAARENNHRLLGATLPPGAAEDPRVRELVDRFRRESGRFMLLAAALAAPIYGVIRYPSLTMIYLLGWMGLLFWLDARMINRYGKALQTLKRENGWLVGKRHVVSVDTDVMMVKDSMPHSALWLILPALVSLVPILLGALADDWTGYMMGGASMATTALMGWLYRVSASRCSTAYCRDTAVNMAINRVTVRMKSLCWILLAAIESAGMMGMYLLISADVREAEFILLLVAAMTVGSLAIILAAFGKISATRERLLASAGEPLVTDDDAYWHGGFYNNPNDPRVLVDKRFGYGSTVNMATAGGKAFLYGTLGFAGILAAVVLVMMIVFDTATFSLTVEGDEAVISAPLYGYSFPVEDIREMTFTDTLPGGSRTNGAATDRYALGNFRLDGYGKCKLYVTKDRPPYLVVQLDGLCVIINGAGEAQTREYYRMLGGE